MPTTIEGKIEEATRLKLEGMDPTENNRSCGRARHLVARVFVAARAQC
eukprot:SAG31_NODE_4838_length_2913_cov_2.769367_4_plen_48_part_00